MQTQPLSIEPSSISAGAEVFSVQAFDILHFSSEIVRFLNMVERPEWTALHVLDELAAKRAQCFLIASMGTVRGLCITKIQTDARGKYGLIWIAAGIADGDLQLQQGMRAFLDVIEPWLKSVGCERVRINGRPGWKKALPEYEMKAVVLEKSL